MIYAPKRHESPLRDLHLRNTVDINVHCNHKKYVLIFKLSHVFWVLNAFLFI